VRNNTQLGSQVLQFNSALMSSPSMRIFPFSCSTNLNKVLNNVVFTLPVLPTTPTPVSSTNVQVIPLRTKGAFGRYLIFLSPRTKLLKQKLWIQGERPNLLLLVSLIPSGPATLFFHEVATRKEVSCVLYSCWRFWWYMHELLDPFNRHNVVWRIAVIPGHNHLDGIQSKRIRKR